MTCRVTGTRPDPSGAERRVQSRIRDLEVKTLDDVRAHKPKLVGFSPEMQTKVDELKQRLFDRLYNHYRVRRMAMKADRIMTGLFETYMAEPRQMPPHVFARIGGGEEVSRVVADYVAGMTDRFALDEYKKLFDPYERV